MLMLRWDALRCLLALSFSCIFGLSLSLHLVPPRRKRALRSSVARTWPFTELLVFLTGALLVLRGGFKLCRFFELLALTVSPAAASTGVARKSLGVTVFFT